MSAWFCIITSDNWPIVRDKKLYSVPRSARRTFSQVKKGDIFLFYLTSPIRGVIGVYEAVSDTFETQELSPWQDRLYPYRVVIKPLSNITSELREPIPFDKIVGKAEKIKSGYSLYGKSLIPLSQEEYREITKGLQGV